MTKKFNVTRDRKGRCVLVIESSRITESIEYLHKTGIKHVVVNRSCGYHISQLDFLQSLTSFLEGLVIVDDHYEFGKVNGLRRLKTLGLPDNKRDIIDLSNFPELEECAIEFSPRLHGLEACKKLVQLNLTNYSSDSDSFIGFPKLRSLIEMILIKPKLRKLDGIGILNRLKSLQLVKGSRLETVAALSELAKSIEEVSFEKCGRVKDFESLGKIKHLKKIQMFNSGKISSLAFVKSLNKLEFLSFVGTNVVDGDISPAIGLKYVGFDDKRHYSHKFFEISGGFR